MNQSEDEQLRRLLRVLEVAVRWERDITGNGEPLWRVSPGSDLEADDKISHPFNVSPAPWAAMTAAISHLAVLRDSMFSPDSGKADAILARVHTHGQLTLVRGALENACMAYWLLEPAAPEDRIVRRMQQDLDEIRQLDRVKSEINPVSQPIFLERKRQMEDLLKAAGLDFGRLNERRPGYGDIVKSVGSARPMGGVAPFVVWKACSAIAHGELRGTVAYLSSAPLSTHAPGMQASRITGNVELVVGGASMAVDVTGAALELYGYRGGCDLPIRST